MSPVLDNSDPDGIDLKAVRDFLRSFAEDRNWEQFHTPKNLAMALAAEAGELLDVFQWLTPEQSLNLDASQMAAAEEELADVLQYLIRLADVLGVNLNSALWLKLTSNETRFPVSHKRAPTPEADR